MSIIVCNRGHHPIDTVMTRDNYTNCIKNTLFFEAGHNQCPSIHALWALMRVADGYRWQVEQRTLLGNPIDKFSLLGLIAKQYKKPITIDPDDTVVIGRTLDSSRFSLATG